MAKPTRPKSGPKFGTKPAPRGASKSSGDSASSRPARPKFGTKPSPRDASGDLGASRPTRPSAKAPAAPKAEGQVRHSGAKARVGATRAAAPRPQTEQAKPGPRPARSSFPAKAKPTGPRPHLDAANKAAAAKPAVKRPRNDHGERLQKILAAAGIASRRACEDIILEGRVQVNGKTITELGTKADPRRDEITVDFVPIAKEELVYILLNKPKGYITTVKDDHGRPTVMALVHGVDARVYPVGRLDFNSEGLLLLTNDGEMAQKLSGPEHEVPKVYLVKIHRQPRAETLKELQEGFRLDGKRLRPCHIEYFDKADNPWMKVTLTEGKNQQIRRMFAAVGHPVSKLRRVQYGPISDPALKPGEWRFLNPQEMAVLKSM